MADTSTIGGSINGYATNIPFQGNQNIPVQSIAPVTPMSIPPVQYNPSQYTTAISNTQADISGGLAQATQQATDATANADQARSQGISLANLIYGEEANNVKDTAGVYNATGVNALYGQLQDLNAQATGLKNEASAIPIQNGLNYQGSAGTQGQVTSVNRDQLSQNALKALSLGQQYAIASGNYEKAKSYADQLIDTKYAAETARIDALKEQQSALDKYVLTPAQQKELEATKKKTDLEQKQLDQKIADDKEVSKLIIDASAVAPPDILAKAKEIQDKGGTATQVALSLGQYGADYLKNLAYKSQLETDKAQRANIYSQIGERNKVAIQSGDLASFQAPPIMNPVTGRPDPKGVVASIVKAGGSKLKGGQSALDVLTTLQSFADRNKDGKFPGLGLTSGFSEGLIGDRLASAAQIANKQDLNAINLKVQQWASGASLTAQQTAQVNELVPKVTDSDNLVKQKTNGLVNFMLQTVSSDLAGQGVNYAPGPVDLFGGFSSMGNGELLNQIPSLNPSSTQNLVDNKSFFNR